MTDQQVAAQFSDDYGAMIRAGVPDEQVARVAQLQGWSAADAKQIVLNNGGGRAAPLSPPMYTAAVRTAGPGQGAPRMPDPNRPANADQLNAASAWEGMTPKTAKVWKTYVKALVNLAKKGDPSAYELLQSMGIVE